VQEQDTAPLDKNRKTRTKGPAVSNSGNKEAVKNVSESRRERGHTLNEGEKTSRREETRSYNQSDQRKEEGKSQEVSGSEDSQGTKDTDLRTKKFGTSKPK